MNFSLLSPFYETSGWASGFATLGCHSLGLLPLANQHGSSFRFSLSYSFSAGANRAFPALSPFCRGFAFSYFPSRFLVAPLNQLAAAFGIPRDQ